MSMCKPHVVNLPPPLPQRELFSGAPLVSAVGLGAWPLAGAHGPVGKNDGIAAVLAARSEESIFKFRRKRQKYLQSTEI